MSLTITEQQIEQVKSSLTEEQIQELQSSLTEEQAKQLKVLIEEDENFKEELRNNPQLALEKVGLKAYAEKLEAMFANSDLDQELSEEQLESVAGGNPFLLGVIVGLLLSK